MPNCIERASPSTATLTTRTLGESSHPHATRTLNRTTQNVEQEKQQGPRWEQARQATEQARSATWGEWNQDEKHKEAPVGEVQQATSDRQWSDLHVTIFPPMPPAGETPAAEEEAVFDDWQRGRRLDQARQATDQARNSNCKGERNKEEKHKEQPVAEAQQAEGQTKLLIDQAEQARKLADGSRQATEEHDEEVVAKWAEIEELIASKEFDNSPRFHWMDWDDLTEEEGKTRSETERELEVAFSE